MVLLFSCPCFGQDCSAVKQKTDAFTKEVVSTASLKCGNVLINLEHSGPKYFVGFSFMMGSYSDAAIPKGDKVMLRLDNDEIVAIENDNNVQPSSTAGGVIWTRWTTRSEVDKETFAKLGKHAIAGMRFTIAGREQTDAVKEKQANKILDAAACMAGGK